MEKKRTIELPSGKIAQVRFREDPMFPDNIVALYENATADKEIEEIGSTKAAFNRIILGVKITELTPVSFNRIPTFFELSITDINYMLEAFEEIKLQANELEPVYFIDWYADNYID